MEGSARAERAAGRASPRRAREDGGLSRKRPAPCIVHVSWWPPWAPARLLIDAKPGRPAGRRRGACRLL